MKDSICRNCGQWQYPTTKIDHPEEYMDCTNDCVGIKGGWVQEEESTP